MKNFLLAPLAAMLIAGSSIAMVAQPAMAWDKQFCESGAAGKESSNPAAGQEAIAWCQYNFPNVTPPSATATGGTATASQSQKQQQTQSLNNRLNQSLVNSPTSYTNVRETGQLPMVNAPECGGVNAGVSADLTGSVALSAAVHFGRRPDSCVHHDDAPPTTNVHVDVAAAAPVVQPAPIVAHEVRTVYVKQAIVSRCRNYPASDLRAAYLDLKAAKHTRDLVRIHSDRAILEAACRGDLVDKAVDG